MPPEVLAQLEALKEFIKVQQDALLVAVSKQAGVPMEIPKEPEPPPPPVTKESLTLQLGKIFIEAWTDMGQRQNSRQLAIFNRMNKPDAQLLLKKILDFKE